MRKIILTIAIGLSSGAISMPGSACGTVLPEGVPPGGKQAPLRPGLPITDGIVEPVDSHRLPTQHWPLRSAKPTAAFQDPECSSAFIATLDTEALVNYLRTHPVDGCLADFLWDFNEDLAQTFTDESMQAVFDSIEGLSPGYDGTNTLGLQQLWFFPHVGYFYEFFEEDVSEFSQETLAAHIAASAAFAASDRIYDSNDEATDVLAEWLTVTDRDGLRHRHLSEIKHVLLNMTPERSESTSQRAAYNNTFFILFRGFVNSDEDYLQAIAEDPDLVDVLRQVSLYEFLYPDLSYLVENAIRELARLVEVASLREEVVTALTDVLPVYPRLSSAFLLVTEGLEEHVDCQTQGICRDDLVDEITGLALPNTFVFDDGAMVVETSLEANVVQGLYHAAKQVQSQFYRVIESTTPAPGDVNETLIMKVFGTRAEYERYQGFLHGLDTDNGGIYIEGDATFYTYQRTPQESTFTLEELFRHEYVHYLFARYVHEGLWGTTELYEDCRLTWVDEGLAEFLAASTQADGIPVRRGLVESIGSDGADRLTVAQTVNSCYSEGFKFYRYGGLLFNHFYDNRRTELIQLLEVIRTGDVFAFDTIVDDMESDTDLETEYQSFIDEQLTISDQLQDPSTSFPRLASLQTDLAGDLEPVFRQTASDSDADCAVSATELNHRFGCQGRLLGTLEIGGDPGETNRFFSQTLDEMIGASIIDGRLNNFEAMNCHFAQISPGALPEASYVCDGPLRDSALSLDSDADGVSDELDDFPDDYLGWSDDDDDGMLDPEEMPDTDMDGLPDGFELVFGFDPDDSADALEDADLDGVNNLVEFTRGTDPLNAASLPPVVNLLTFLRNDSFDPRVNDFRSMIVYAGLRLVGGGTATNVRLTFTSATPIRFEDTVVNEQSLRDCVIAEQSAFGGVFDCGDFSEESNLLDIFLYFTPLQSGNLDFELTFAADEIETDPSDNTQHLTDAVIQPDPNTAAADFDADGIVGFGDFFLFVDAFGGTDPLFDLDGGGYC